MSTIHRKVYDMAAQKGGIIRIPGPPAPLGKGTIVAVTDPLILKEIAAQEFEGVTKPPNLYKVFATVSIRMLSGVMRRVHTCF